MKVAIIADDLTGANDSGVQLARYGLKTSVLLDWNRESMDTSDIVIFDTDSRSLPEAEAYTRVKEVSQFLKHEQFDVIYKKMDSTMRGNVGAELNAVDEILNPDFIIIAPAYPKNGREIIDGNHYLHHRLLHETEVARDPKTPVKESFLPKLLQEQTNQTIGHISLKDLHLGATYIKERLSEFKKQSIRYVLFDSKEEADLTIVADVIRQMDAFVIWAGSAGLADHLPESFGLRRQEQDLQLEQNTSSVLLVMGSVSRVGREQLENVLSDTRVKGIQMHSELIVADSQLRVVEIGRVYEEAVQAIDRGVHVVLYSSGEPDDIELAFRIGEQKGLDQKGVSDLISLYLGKISSQLIKQFSINRVVLTGGDTAKQVFMQVGASEFVLLDEIEPGIPLGYVNGKQLIYAVTKAGSFGSPMALSNALKKLQGQEG